MSRPFAHALLLTLVACVEPDPDPEFDPAHPQDDVLTFAHVQAEGTHNSYHLRPDPLLSDEWDYSHAPLDVQLEEQGVRQFELDTEHDPDTLRFLVRHVAVLDPESTCATLEACAGVLRDWSDAHPGHHPLMILVEPKVGPGDVDVELWFERLEAEIAVHWPPGRAITPAEVQGEHATLRDAVETAGWPTLGTLRGRALWVLHETGDLREHYTHGGEHAEDRLLFPDASGDPDLPYAAVHTMNDPVLGGDAIGEVVDRGHLVRTRVDSGNAPAPDRFQVALGTGAHWLTTDFPAPREPGGYAVVLPGGSPSRCNPRTAPGSCTPEAVEDPARLAP